MPLYEHVFLARQDLAQAQVDALAENATKILTDNGGKVVKTETWGLRSLAYRMAKNRKAHYVALDVDAPPAAIAELERQTNINEDVIRFMTIRVEELDDQDRDRAAALGTHVSQLVLHAGPHATQVDGIDAVEPLGFRARGLDVPPHERTPPLRSLVPVGRQLEGARPHDGSRPDPHGPRPTPRHACPRRTARRT